MLTTLVERVAGARGAVFCDHEGESVELVLRDPQLSEYDMKIAGAQLAAVWLSLQDSSRQTAIGAMEELHVSCASGSLICRALRDGYYVVLLIARGAAISPAEFELRAAAAEISSAL